VPIAGAAEEAIKLVKHGTLKVYEGAPHGIYGEYQDILIKDVMAFIKE
jgi:non-heme chloroperoxidase